MSSTDIKAAIVIPAYKHPGLMIETLASAFRQETDFLFAVVVVNDGCPFRETDYVCREFALSQPNMYYIHQANKGLSGARNVGIEFCLSVFENLSAIQFLDADDVMCPRMLRRLFLVLEKSGSEVGWAFTDRNEFGFDTFGDLSGGYNPGEHLIRNVTPASSMVARRMLAAGARFDETMKLGMEDWDFWLQGLSLGFRGVHVPAAGLRYRHRAESMSRETSRQEDMIHEYLGAKHVDLFSIDGLLRHEVRHLPRFAIVTPGSDRVRYLTDPDAEPAAIDLATFLERLCRSPHRPGPGLLPPLILVLDAGAEAVLVRHGLLRSVLWSLQRGASGARFAALFLDSGPDDALAVEFALKPNQKDAFPAAARGLMIATDILIQMTENAPDPPPVDAREPLRSLMIPWLTARAPAAAEPPPNASPQAAETLRRLISDVSARWLGGGLDCWSGAEMGRHRARPIRPERLYARAWDIPSPPPLGPKSRRRCAIVIATGSSEFDHAAIEALAEDQKRGGQEVHLVVLGGTQALWRPSPDLAGLPTLLIPMHLRRRTSPLRGDRLYFGTAFRRTNRDIDNEDNSFTFGALIVFDRVVLVGCEAHFLVGPLGRAGVEVLAAARLEDAESIEASAPWYGGSTMLLGALAYEHGLAGVIPGDGVGPLLKGLGVPESKLRIGETAA